MTTSYVHDIFPSYQRSFKLASAIDVIGALQQDTEFAIGGTVGAVADTIPMSINVRDPERQINKTYHVRVIKDPVLTPTLLAAVASEAIGTSVGQTSDKMLRIGMRMQIDGAEPIVKHNYIYSPGDISEAALADLGQSLAITQQNEFARGSIHRIDLTVALESVRKTAHIKSMFADRNKVKAGESVTVNVVLEEVDNPNKTSIKSFTFAVPADAPTGVMRIAAGAASSYYPLRMKVGAPAPDPTNLNELIAAYMRMGGRNELEVQASTPDTYLLIDRKKVSDPAPSWTRLLKNSASTSVGSYNEVSELRETTDYSLSGSLTISIPVESLKDRDKLSPNGEAVATVATAVETGNGDDDKPALAADDTDGDDAAEGADDEDNANYRARRLERLFTTSKFLNNLKLWQRFAAAPPVARQEAPPRLPGDRPITPTITSPTPTPMPKPTPAPTPVPTPIALPLDKGKGLGRPALSWVQASPTDFLRGTFVRAQVGSEGTIRLSPPTRMLDTTTENFAWSVAGDKAGNSYLGTGNQARILKIDAEGHVSTLYDGPEVAVTALCTDAAGNLYAGVSPGGRVYRFAPDGKKTEIFNCDQTFIWALAWDRTGNLLIGTGGANGRLYRIHINPSLGSEVVGVAATGSAGAATPPQSQIAPFAVFAQKHVRAIAVSDNDIYVGTADDGVLYRVDGTTGATTALYQVVPAARTVGAGSVTTPVSLPISLAALLGATSATATKATGEITSVVAAKDGVYFGTLNSGTIYRYTEEAGTVALYPSPQQSVYSLALNSDGKLFAATGDKGVVYQIEPSANPGDVRGARVLEPTQLQSIALGITPAGNLLVGTGNNAAIYSIDLAANSPEANSGTYTSAILDAHNTVRWGALRTMGDAALETRSGNTLQPDTTWSPWLPAERNDLGELRIASPAARYLQYRAQLTAHQGAAEPSLSRVEIVYRATNMPPTVAFSAPRGGEYWNKQKKLTWLAIDPNADPLAYRLWLSADDGKSWDSQTLQNDKLPAFELDTTKLKDGTYRARVEASDAGRNPEDPMKDEAIGAPFVIDNTPPVVTGGTAHRNADGSISIAATTTDALSPLISAEWRLTPVKPETTAAVAPSNAVPSKTSVASGKATTRKAAPPTAKTAAAVARPGTPATAAPAPTPVPTPTQLLLTDGWNAAGTADSIFDSRRESIVATVPADKAAAATERTIELRVRDAADNISIITLTVA
jgi:sugar lactone lactonase YvrE